MKGDWIVAGGRVLLDTADDPAQIMQERDAALAKLAELQAAHATQMAAKTTAHDDLATANAALATKLAEMQKALHDAGLVLQHAEQT